MPSFPLDVSASLNPLKVADFNVGIAEQWLESARNGGGTENPVPEIDGYLHAALMACKRAREHLRELPIPFPTQGSDQ